jgi:hypothetical protein
MKLKFKDLLYVHAAQRIEENTHPNSLEGEIDCLRQAKVFLIESLPSAHNNDAESVNARRLALALPFKCCYFESGRKGIGFAAVGDDTNPVAFDIQAILVNERSPGNFSGWIFSEDAGGPRTMPFLIGSRTPDAATEALAVWERVAGCILDSICDYVHSCHLGTESVHRTVNHKTITYGKCLHKVENILRLSPTMKKSYPEPAFSREIDWNMQWWVRGHWRKLPSDQILGKDRTGEYKVKGFTWVTEHLRGPEDKPIRNTTYSIGAQQ